MLELGLSLFDQGMAPFTLAKPGAWDWVAVEVAVGERKTLSVLRDYG